MVRITPEIVLADREIRERFVPAAGAPSRTEARPPAGVELRLDLHASSLPKPVKWRLLTLGGHRVTTQGVLIVVSRGQRSQARNREAARNRLIDIIQAAAATPRERVPTAPPRLARPPRTTGRAHSALHRAAVGKLE